MLGLADSQCSNTAHIGYLTASGNQFCCLNGLLLQYLTDDCQIVTATGSHGLQSSDNFWCSVLRTCSLYGIVHSRVQNCLLVHIRSLDFTLG